MQDHAGDEDLDMLPCYSPEIYSACFGISSLTKFGWWKIGLWTPWDVSPLDGLSWIITNHHVYLVRICVQILPEWFVGCRLVQWCYGHWTPRHPALEASWRCWHVSLGNPQRPVPAVWSPELQQKMKDFKRVFQSVMSHGGSENDGGGWRTWRNLTEYLGG